MELFDRMKKYESASKTSLPIRLPVIVRVDGRSFSKYTSSLEHNNPILTRAMQDAALLMCNDIMGAKMAYTQSDEISVVVDPWSGNDSQAWFDNDTQKIVSVCASMAASVVSVASKEIFGETKIAQFDARAFVVPDYEVINYLIWRQQDAVRNSIQGFARVHFSHKELHKKNQGDMLKMLEEKGVPWSKLPNWLKHGTTIVRTLDSQGRNKFGLDLEAPLFVTNKDYVTSRVSNGEQQ